MSEDWFTVLTQKCQNLDSILLFGVYAMVQTGLSEREAVRTIADAEVFAHHERPLATAFRSNFATCAPTGSLAQVAAIAGASEGA